MKRLSLALVAIFALSACGSDEKKPEGPGVAPTPSIGDDNFPQETGTPFGRWNTALRQDQQGMLSRVLLHVNRKNEVALGVYCARNDGQMNIEVEKLAIAKAKIEGNNFELLENVRIVAKNQDGSDFCEASIGPAKMLWQFQNEVLTLTDESGNNPTELTRRQ